MEKKGKICNVDCLSKSFRNIFYCVIREQEIVRKHSHFALHAMCHYILRLKNAKLFPSFGIFFFLDTERSSYLQIENPF